MASEPILTVAYSGLPILTVDEVGHCVIDKQGVSRARIDGSLLEIDSLPMRLKLTRLGHMEKLATCDPYLKALTSGTAVYDALPPKVKRRASMAIVSAVLDAVIQVAKKGVN